MDLAEVASGDEIVVRANYYPAWRAYSDGRELALYARDGQLGFRAPRSGSFVVRLAYPRYRAVSAVALTALVLGLWALYRWPSA